MAAKLVSVREFARQFGVSHTAVQKAIKSGRLVRSVVNDANGKPKLDAEVAAQEWESNTDKNKQTHYGELAKPESPLQAKPREEPRPEAGAPASTTYLQSRAIREAYAARLARLEYEQRAGSLVEAEKVKISAFRVARIVRDAVLGVADRIDAELASLDDRSKVNKLLKEELTKALQELIDAGQR